MAVLNLILAEHLYLRMKSGRHIVFSDYPTDPMYLVQLLILDLLIRNALHKGLEEQQLGVFLIAYPVFVVAGASLQQLVVRPKSGF